MADYYGIASVGDPRGAWSVLRGAAAGMCTQHQNQVIRFIVNRDRQISFRVTQLFCRSKIWIG